MHKRSSARGMTMMEVVIASAVFALVISMSFMITIRATKSFSEQVREGTLADKCEKLLKSMEEELSDATLIASGSNPVFDVTYDSNTNGTMYFPQAEIRYKVPLRYKNPTTNPKGYTVFISPVTIVYDNGNALNKPTFANDGTGGGDFDFRLRYGWRDSARFVENADDNNALVPLQGPGLNVSGSSLPPGVSVSSSSFGDGTGATYPAGTLKGGYMCFRFQPNDGLTIGKFGKNGIISEYEEDLDIDGDGQKYSRFAIGHLERSYYVGDPGYENLVEDSRQVIGDNAVLQPLNSSTSTTGGMDQLQNNRIFSREESNPACLNVFLWLMAMDSEGQPHVMQAKVAIFMRNNATYVTATSATGTN